MAKKKIKTRPKVPKKAKDKSWLQKVDLFQLSLFSFVYISSFAVLLSLPSTVETQRAIPVLAYETEIANEKTPVLKTHDSFPLLSAQSVLVVDMNSDMILYEKNPDQLSLPASTTKIITALVALDAFPLDKIITVNSYPIGQRMSLMQGEKISSRNLLLGLLVYSANDAAEALAADYPGGRDAFIAAMNAKAKYLGMSRTTFTNPSGLDGVGQMTTARDLVKAGEAAMNNQFFTRAVSTREVTVKSVDGRYEHKLTNINRLIGKVDGILGVKTGWTHNARENLVTYADREGKKIMIALLGSQDRFGETEELVEWIYSAYEWR
jgi:serine-type D-Ala-D-Ala carboxypeptidase (penicillin-binding protein 5/6)